MNRRRLWWYTLIAVLALVILAGAVFVIWAESAAPPMPEAVAALESDAAVTVEQNDWIVFRPTSGASGTGFVFYPGARVDPVSYAPAMRAIAVAGHLAVITPMPLNLAIVDSDAARSVIEAFPVIEGWVVGGHSLGGAMAAKYAGSEPPEVRGLVLWAAYPAGGDDLSGSALAVSSIYGTADGISTPADIEASRPRLPADTAFVAVVGGNHAQFGWYGSQAGDNAATISRHEQQAQVVAATLELMQQISGLAP